MNKSKDAVVVAFLVVVIVFSFGSLVRTMMPSREVAQVVSGSSVCEAVSPAHCYYVAPNGSDSSAGTFATPFKSFKPAIIKAQPGDIIYARGGVYTKANDMIYSSDSTGADYYGMIGIDDYNGWPNFTFPAFSANNGTVAQPITIKNYPGEVPQFAIDSGGVYIANKGYWTIEGLDIAGSTDSSILGIFMIQGSAHDITIQNNNIHDLGLTSDPAQSNAGMIRINRWGVHNIFILNNKIHDMYDPTASGLWQGIDDLHYGGITTLSDQTYVGRTGGNTGYIEIANNEFYHLPEAFYSKNPMTGPIDIHDNIIHDSDSLGIVDSANFYFNHNLVYNVRQGFTSWGLPEPYGTDSLADLTGVNGQIEYNTFAGMTGVVAVAGGNATITNNVFFGLTNRVPGATWDTGWGYISKNGQWGDSASPASSVLQQFHSDNNCFITPYSDFLFATRYTTNPLEFYTFAQGQATFHFDPNSKVVIQSDPTKIFVNPAANNYALISPSQCPGMGVLASDISNVGPQNVPVAPATPPTIPTTPTPPPVVTPPVTTPSVPPPTTPVSTPTVSQAPISGATFGNTSSDGTLNHNNSGPLECGVFTAPTTGTLASFTQLQNTAGGNWKAVLVDANSKTIISNGIGNASPTANGWSTSAFSTPPSVTAGTSYALCFIYDSSVNWSETNSGASGDLFFNTINSYANPTTPTNGVFYNFTPSVYATYVTPPPPVTPAAPTGTIPANPSSVTFSVLNAGSNTSDLSVTWGSASGATSYRYDSELNSGVSWKGQNGNLTTNSVTLSAVPNGDAIYLCVWGENSSGESADNACNSYTVPTSGITTPPPPPATPSVSFSANPTGISSGQSTTLTWSSTNATSCTGNSGWTGTLGLSGTRSVTPTANTTYGISCLGAGGQTNQNVTVIVTTPSVPPPTGTISIGSRVITTSNVKVRLQATTRSNQLGTQHSGSIGTVKNGPVQAQGLTWWAVDFSKGADGWVDGEYLRTQ